MILLGLACICVLRTTLGYLVSGGTRAALKQAPQNISVKSLKTENLNQLLNLNNHSYLVS